MTHLYYLESDRQLSRRRSRRSALAALGMTLWALAPWVAAVVAHYLRTH